MLKWNKNNYTRRDKVLSLCLLERKVHALHGSYLGADCQQMRTEKKTSPELMCFSSTPQCLFSSVNYRDKKSYSLITNVLELVGQYVLYPSLESRLSPLKHNFIILS